VHDDRRELRSLYEELGPVVYRRCLRLLADKEAARDATQEVFVKLMRHPERLRDRREATALVFAAATNHCFNHKRDARRYAVKLAAAAHDTPRAAEDLDPVEQRELQEQLLNGCDETTRAIVREVYGADREKQEVAQALGISRKTVTRKLERLFDRARVLLGGGEP
jgi:RNA polymerase sigma-70 factor, ECF subfamily